MHKRCAQNGFTLVEMMIAVLLLVSGVAILLVGMNAAMTHAEYVSRLQVAQNAAQGALERLEASGFDTLWSGAEYTQARPPNTGQCLGMGEDANCNGILDQGEDADGNGRLDDLVPGGRLAIQIKSADDAAPSSPVLLDLHVAACFSYKGRALGEDQNCNGKLDPGEDKNANEWIDSPTMVSMRVGRAD